MHAAWRAWQIFATSLNYSRWDVNDGLLRQSAQPRSTNFCRVVEGIPQRSAVTLVVQQVYMYTVHCIHRYRDNIECTL